MLHNVLYLLSIDGLWLLLLIVQALYRSCKRMFPHVCIDVNRILYISPLIISHRSEEGLIFLGSKLGDSLLVKYESVRGSAAVDAGEWLSLMRVAVKQVTHSEAEHLLCHVTVQAAADAWHAHLVTASLTL